MSADIDKRLVALRFDKRSHQYDHVTPVQRSMQDKLLARVVGWFAGRPVRHILELGCGTGGLTAKLVEQFPEARIVAVDLAVGMIDQVRDNGMPVDAIVADAEDYVRRDTGQYDLVISNATVQWFTRARETIRICQSLAGHDGLVAFTTFGDRTFHELSTSFREAYLGLGCPPVSHVLSLASPEDWRTWLADGEIEQRELVCTFPDVRSFLRSVQMAGASFSAGTPRLIQRRVLARMMAHYERRFPAVEPLDGRESRGGIRATYHSLTILVRGRPVDAGGDGASS